MRNTCTKEQKRAFVNRLKEPLWIAREWDKVMAFMISGRHLDVGLLITEDMENERGMAGGCEESSSKGKGREPVTRQRGDGSKRHLRIQERTEGGDLVEKEVAYEADEEGSDHQEDATTRTTPPSPGPPGDRSYEESKRESD